MKIPDKVKIGGFEYIVETKETPSLDGAVCFGTHSFNELKIELSNKYPTQVQECTLIHECLHAIAYLHGVGLKESEVSILANGIYAFIQDNPEIFK